jgi:hypothetical protein
VFEQRRAQFAEAVAAEDLPGPGFQKRELGRLFREKVSEPFDFLDFHDVTESPSRNAGYCRRFPAGANEIR